MLALEEKLTSIDSNLDSVPYTIKMAHFKRALARITPSVSKKVCYLTLFLPLNFLFCHLLIIVFKNPQKKKKKRKTNKSSF